jgi:hypothetical protein
MPPSSQEIDMPAGTRYIVEVTDDARTGKIVMPLGRPEVQQPAAAFVFDVLGAEDLASLKRDKQLTDGDLKLLSHLRDVIFTQEGAELVIRDGVSFEANKEILDPDAQFEEYFMPQRKGEGQIYTCTVEIISNDPDRARKRQMLAYQVMFMLHRFKLGYEVRADEVDLLQELSDEAERRNLVRFDMGKNTFVLTEDGERAHRSLVEEAQQLIRRYDIFTDVDVDLSDTDVRFATGHGQDLRVPVWELVGINPFRARFVLGLNDGEWDTLDDWPRRILDPRWFDGVFAFIEQCPTIEDVGRERLERVVDEGKRELRGEAPEGDFDDDDRGYRTVTTYGGPGYYHDPFFGNNWWWLLFLL